MDKQFIYNNITPQNKRSLGQLSVQEWNSIINILVKQSNASTKAIETLHNWVVDGMNEFDFPENLRDAVQSIVDEYKLNTDLTPKYDNALGALKSNFKVYFDTSDSDNNEDFTNYSEASRVFSAPAQQPMFTSMEVLEGEFVEIDDVPDNSYITDTSESSSSQIIDSLESGDTEVSSIANNYDDISIIE